MRLKFQKQSALKLAGRIIPEAERNGIISINSQNFRNRITYSLQWDSYLLLLFKP